MHVTESKEMDPDDYKDYIRDQERDAKEGSKQVRVPE